MSDPSELQKFGYDLVLKSYEHHKDHARFEETQRTWLLTGYLTITGLFANAIFGHQDGGADHSITTNLLVAMLFAHLGLGILIATAISKVSGEFGRHFRRAEMIIKETKSLLSKEKGLSGLLDIAQLDTATYEGATDRRIAFLSNAAIHGYIMALFIAGDVAAISYLWWPDQPIKFVMFAAAAFLLAVYLQQRYVDAVRLRVGPLKLGHE